MDEGIRRNILDGLMSAIKALESGPQQSDLGDRQRLLLALHTAIKIVQAIPTTEIREEANND